MAEFDFEDIEFAENSDPRIPVVLCLDTSDSMSMPMPDGRIPLDELNGGLDVLISELHKDPLAKRRAEISVVSYGTKVAEPTPFATVENLQIPILEKSGLTSSGEAIRVAMQALEDRKKIYKENGLSYYRSILLWLSDGLSTDNINEVSKDLKKAIEQKKLTFMPVAVEGADIEEMSKVGGKQALPLKDMKFDELFQWLSASVSSVSASQIGDRVAAPPVDDWAEL